MTAQLLVLPVALSSELPPPSFMGWSVTVTKKGYFQLFRKVDSKWINIHIGRTWNQEKATQRLNEFYGNRVFEELGNELVTSKQDLEDRLEVSKEDLEDRLEVSKEDLEVSKEDLEDRGNSHTPVKTTPLRVIASAIPQELKDLEQWMVWKYELRINNDDSAKWTKPPFNATTGRKGKSNDSTTWSTFDVALAAYQSGEYDGIGFAFREGDGLAGVDLDHCLDRETGVISKWASDILAQFDGGYIELSPSGEGFRMFAFGKVPRSGKGTDNKAIEVYDSSSPRYLTVTGQVLPNAGIRVIEAQAALDWLHNRYMEKQEKTKEISTGRGGKKRNKTYRHETLSRPG